MPRTRSATLAVLLLLTLPALLVATPPAIAQDSVVPFAPAVPFETQTPFEHKAYLVFADAANNPASPNCGAPGIAWSAKQAPAGSARSACAFPVTSASAPDGTPVGSGLNPVQTFQMPADNLVRGFNVTGNQSLVIHHAGRIPTGTTLSVSVYSGARLIGSALLRPNQQDTMPGTPVHQAFIVFDNNANQAVFDVKQPLRVVFRPNTDGVGGAPAATPSTYTIDDTDTWLSIRSRDAIRAAAWVGEARSPIVKTLWRPLPPETPLATAPRIQLYFSIQSSFGDDPLVSDAPVFSMTRNGTEPVYLTAGGVTHVDARENGTLADSSNGIRTWTLPTGQTLDYRGWVAGEYLLRVQATHPHGTGYLVGTTSRFLITAQAVSLQPFKERERGVTLADETTGHELSPGGSTTYILLVNNTGAANDTFTLGATFVTGSPASGWSATIAGPALRGRTVTLAPGQAEIVAVTITAPPGAQVGSSSIFRVNATSALDPTASSPAVTLSSTVTNAVRREVAILVPSPSTDLEPGVDREIPVFVWNRGTRPANISLDLQETPITGWNVDLVQGGLPVQRIVLSNVPAGGIAEATLRARGPATQAVRTYSVVLNATSLDAQGVAFDRTVRFGLTSMGGASLQVLESIGGLGHVLEVGGSAAYPDGDGGDGGPGIPGLPANPADGCSPPQSCYRDNVSGAWYRVWITNTGRGAEAFALSVDPRSVRIDVDNNCNAEGVFSGVNPNTPGFRFYARTASGRATELDQTPVIAPGDTVEVYVWRGINGAANACATNDLSFVVTARGVTSGTLGTAGVEASAENVNGRQAVLLEAVGRRPVNERTPDAGPFLVDIANASRRALTGSVAVNESVTYRVRVTNAASWGPHLDANGRVVEPRVNVYAEGTVAKQAGWNISIRPVFDAVDNPSRDGVANYSFTNEVRGRVEGWLDLELEVKVTAPSAANGTALAGTSGVFFLRAEMPGREGASTLELTTFVSRSADIVVASDAPTLNAHAGRAAPTLLIVSNQGSAEANVTLRATIDPTTPNAAGWRVDPASQNFRVSAFRNRTVALLVTPPPGAGPGTLARVNVIAEYTPTSKGNFTLQLPVSVAAPGTLELSSPQTDATIAPGGYANFTLNVRNTGNIRIPFRLVASPMPEWELSLGATAGELNPGETRNVPFVLKAPASAEDHSRFASVVRVVEDGNDGNFDARSFGINILGGKAAPGVSAPVLQKRVDRGGITTFPLEVRNTGNAAGRIPLEVRSADPAWQVSVRNEANETVGSVSLRPNELAVLNVTVQAPLVVPERTEVAIDVTASSEDFSQSSKATLRAEIHDYGLSLSVLPSRIETAPGVAAEFILRLRNTGNDNDTLNVSAQLLDLPDWTVSFTQQEITLEAGAEGEIRALVRSPLSPLPSPRTYPLKFFAGTLGGRDVQLWRNESVNAQVVVLPYRALDVDRDDRLEVVLNADGRDANGFEVFREISNDGFQSVVVATGFLEGKARFFLDMPRDGRSLDGIADVWFDPEAVYAYDIQHAIDVNGDGTPDYLLDTDRNGRIERAYDTVTDTYWNVQEVKALGNDAIQYVIDTNLDAKPDWYYDPTQEKATRIQSVSGQGANVVGIDTDNDGKVDKYYDFKAKTVSDVKVARVSGLLVKYWWFFALFALMLVATIALLVRRNRRA